MSEENNINSGLILEYLFILTQVEVMIIIRIYIYV